MTKVGFEHWLIWSVYTAVVSTAWLSRLKQRMLSLMVVAFHILSKMDLIYGNRRAKLRTLL